MGNLNEKWDADLHTKKVSKYNKKTTKNVCLNVT